MKLRDKGWPTKIVLPSIRHNKYQNNHDATMRPLRLTCVTTPEKKVAIDWSVLQPATNYTYGMKSTNVCYKICFITLLITTTFPSLWRSSSG